MQQQGKERPIRVTLQSTIQHPEQPIDQYRIQLDGTIVDKGAFRYVRFEEKLDGQYVKTTIKFGREEAVILRSGDVKMRLPFSLQEERAGSYRNGLMTIPLIVKTQTLLDKRNELTKQGEWIVQYELFAESTLLGTYRLTIHYTEGHA